MWRYAYAYVADQSWRLKERLPPNALPNAAEPPDAAPREMVLKNFFALLNCNKSA